MKTFMLTGVAALLGMTAIPAHAQTDMDHTASIVIAQADLNDSDSDDITDLTVRRYYSPDRATYATFDRNTGMWTFWSGETNTVVETRAQASFDPDADGWIYAEGDLSADAVTDYRDGDSDDITDLTRERFYNDDRSVYAVRGTDGSWMVYDASNGQMVENLGSDFDPMARGYVHLDMDAEDRGDTSAMANAGTRYYTPDNRQYVMRNDGDSKWYVFDVSNDARIGVVTDSAFDPVSQGWSTAAVDLRDSDRDDITDLTGRAEERYYDADRTSYGIYDPESRMWSVYSASDERLLQTVPDNQYTRYEQGYTVVLPGDMQSTMSADTGFGAVDMRDSDRDDITDVTQ